MMKVPSEFKPLARKRATDQSVSCAIEFLCRIWAGYADGEFKCVSTKCKVSGEWRDHFISKDLRKSLIKLFRKFPFEKYDVYFCPNSFKEERRSKDRAYDTCYAWSDVDDTDPQSFKPKPNILWKSSKNRYQAIWIWKKSAEPREAEQYTKNLWKLYGGDKGAWSITKVLRVPGTTNHKPERDGDYVRLLRFNPKPQRLSKQIADLSDLREKTATTGEVDPLAHDPKKIMRKYRLRMGNSAGTLMTATKAATDDRSGKLICIAAKMWELGASDNEVACVLRINPNFTEKWGENLAELERQVLNMRSYWENS
jgi:hypothetical protein